MARDRMAVCELWDVTLPPLPPRSRLYHLTPVGLGTPYVESLTGYVARLAEAHNVRTRALVVHELLPLLGRQYLSKPVNSSLSSFWRKDARAVNGIRTMARDWVQVLQRLTGRCDLHFLTLLTWAKVLTSKGLLRLTHAWCPACYQEWAETGRKIYEPLLWGVAAVTGCPRHRRRLSTRCPYADCRQTLPLLGPRSRPGHCPQCGRWLGLPEGAVLPEDESLPEDELLWQTWVVDSVGELMASAPGLSAPPQRERVTETLSVYVEQVTKGNRKALSCQLGLHKDKIRTWLTKGTVPQFDLLLQVCYNLGTSPLRFLTEDPIVVDLDKMNVTRKKESPCKPLTAPRPLDVEQVRCALEAALASDEHPPPAMRQIAKRLGRHHALLVQHFPDMCRAISARYKAYQTKCGREKRQRLCDEVLKAVLSVHAQNVYPSASRVAALLRTPGAIRHPEAQATWREALQELGWTS